MTELSPLESNLDVIILSPETKSIVKKVYIKQTNFIVLKPIERDDKFIVSSMDSVYLNLKKVPKYFINLSIFIFFITIVLDSSLLSLYLSFSFYL